VTSLIFLLFLVFCIHFIAKERGFYTLEKGTGSLTPTLAELLLVFGIYLTTLLFVGPYLNQLIAKLELAHFVTISLCLLLLLVTSYLMRRELFYKIWKNRAVTSRSIGSDLIFGMLTYLISLPVVLLIGEAAEGATQLLFGKREYEQVAVTYFKAMVRSPGTLLRACLTILIIGPVTEELLFRGFLQNYLKGYLNRIGAILLASFLFALFHFSPAQSIGNIPILASLFAFSFFLGYVYEKRASLFSSIGLHMAFNAATLLRLFLSQE